MMRRRIGIRLSIVFAITLYFVLCTLYFAITLYFVFFVFCILYFFETGLQGKGRNFAVLKIE